MSPPAIRRVIGVDLGGTNVRAAQVDRYGELLATRQEPVDRDPARPPFAQLVSLIEAVNDAGGELAGVGVSVTGPVDPVSGWVENPYTLPPAMQGDLAGAIRSRFDVEVAVENDANAAALGETFFGAGRGAETIVCMTVGTGIGIGVVHRGIIHGGAARAHPEAGHLVIDPSGPACYCGASGCIESMASATSLVAAGRAAGVIGDRGSARDIHEAARAGDPVAREIVGRAVRAIAAGVRTLVSVHAPDVVVLAGGAHGLDDESLAVVQHAASSFPFGAREVSVRIGELGIWAGCIGAAALIHRSDADRIASPTMAR